MNQGQFEAIVSRLDRLIALSQERKTLMNAAQFEELNARLQEQEVLLQRIIGMLEQLSQAPEETPVETVDAKPAKKAKSK